MIKGVDLVLILGLHKIKRFQTSSSVTALAGSITVGVERRHSFRLQYAHGIDPSCPKHRNREKVSNHRHVKDPPYNIEKINKEPHQWTFVLNRSTVYRSVYFIIFLILYVGKAITEVNHIIVFIVLQYFFKGNEQEHNYTMKFPFLCRKQVRVLLKPNPLYKPYMVFYRVFQAGTNNRFFSLLPFATHKSSGLEVIIISCRESF